MKKKQILLVFLCLIVAFASFMHIRTLVIYRAQYFHDWQSVLNYSVLLLGVGGLVQYLYTGQKNSRLLRIWLYYNLVCFMMRSITLLPYPFLAHKQVNFYISGVRLGPLLVKNWLWSLPYATCNCYCLIILNQFRQTALEPLPYGEETTYVFHPVSKWMRLAIRLCDVGLVVLVLVIYGPALQILLDEYGVGYFLRADLSFRLAVGVLLFIYYLLLEGFIGISLGKILTNTVVVNESGQKPAIGTMLKRAFCRLIPVDGLSFLFSDRGWHDSLSGTYVTRGRYDWE
jgi:uncharacterized RDD family membrane protein YckC